jgi:hypothetical protein
MLFPDPITFSSLKSIVFNVVSLKSTIRDTYHHSLTSPVITFIPYRKILSIYLHDHSSDGPVTHWPALLQWPSHSILHTWSQLHNHSTTKFMGFYPLATISLLSSTSLFLIHPTKQLFNHSFLNFWKTISYHFLFQLPTCISVMTLTAISLRRNEQKQSEVDFHQMLT